MDDRPCNRLFPYQLAAIVGLEVQQPPRDLLGWFTTPGNCDALADWVRNCPTQHLVLSLDMLCYGGLVAGRASDTEATVALARLENLREVKQSRPDLTIYASNNLPRLGLTVSQASLLEAHHDLISYSMLADRVERLGEEQARAELDAVRAKLDPEVLNQYLAVRTRNHTLSRRAVELTAEGVFAHLTLVQEDAASVGLHLGEQEDLQQLIAECSVSEQVEIHPGADEVGIVLLARHCSLASGQPPRLCADYANDAGSRVIPRYEDRPLRDTVTSTLRAAGAVPAPPMNADAIMFVHTPLGEQKESTEAPPQGHAPSIALQSESITERLQFANEAGVITGVADVMYANGGDPELLAALGRTETGKKLRAYAGWNTSSNTIGTLVAQLCLETIAAREKTVGLPASRRFLACRLADDFTYQTLIRPQAVEKAAALGADQFVLGESWSQVEEYVRQTLLPSAENTISTTLGVSLRDLGPELHVSLPWHRLFEVEVDLPPPAG